jgi:hypothetical protein
MTPAGRIGKPCILAQRAFDHRPKKKVLHPQDSSPTVGVRNKHRTRQAAPVSIPSTLAKTLPAAILETVLKRLATLFLSGAGGDITTARHAAAEMLAAYQPETAQELRLAALLVCFSFHALEALSQAADPDLPLTKILRLRGSAVSLNRESDKAQRRLDQIQQARREGAPEQPEPQPVQTQPSPEPAPIQTTTKPTFSTWTVADQQAEDLRIAASVKRAEARVAALSNPPPTQIAAHTA